MTRTSSAAAQQGDYLGHCQKKAAELRQIGGVNRATVAYLFSKTVTKLNPQADQVARILNNMGYHFWESIVVAEAYRLRNEPQAELDRIDPKKQQPAAPLPENLARLNEFSAHLKATTTQSAPPRR